MDYGKKIAYLRKSKGMTQEDLGKVLNVTYQAVSKWERGESLPDFETMSQIAKYFQVPLGYFADGEENFQQPERTATVKDTNNFVGMCTECGKMLNEGEVFTSSPKIICKSCAERRKQEDMRKEQEERERREFQRNREIAEQRGGGFDAKLIISLILALVCYVLFTVFTLNGTFDADSGFGGFLTFLVPLAVFGCIHALCDFINDLRDVDGPDGYTRNLSLIIGGAFAIVNLACFLALYLSTHETVLIFMLILGVVLSFTFVSQFMWGAVIQEIFTAGGFTFKLPGFIFSLSFDSILFMIIAKIFLGIIAALVFIVTTVLMAVVAIVGSVFTFIPCIIIKSIKDKKA